MRVCKLKYRRKDSNTTVTNKQVEMTVELWVNLMSPSPCQYVCLQAGVKLSKFFEVDTIYCGVRKMYLHDGISAHNQWSGKVRGHNSSSSHSDEYNIQKSWDNISMSWNDCT